ncbi:MAG: zinc dependent phospholipase C family protein [Spirochaetia bacterium]
MPKEIYHWYLARKMKDALVSQKTACPVKNAVLAYPGLFYLGSVFPDNAFYYTQGPAKQDFQKAALGFHGKTQVHPLNFAKKTIDSRTSKTDAFLSFVSGFCSHISSDTVYHPFIFYFTGFPDKEKTWEARHRAFESFLDLYILKSGFTPEFGKTVHSLLSSLSVSEEALLDILQQCYENRISRDQIRYCLKKHGNYQKLFFYFPVRVFVSIAAVLGVSGMKVNKESFYPLLPGKAEQFFRQQFTYKHPVTGDEYEHTLGELTDQAVSRFLTAAAQLGSYWTGHTETKFIPELDRSLDTGLHRSAKQEMTYSNPIDVYSSMKSGSIQS